MDKKQCVFRILLFLSIVVIVLGIKANILKEDCQNMKFRSSGDDNSHLFHLDGIVVEKDFDILLVELSAREESNLFFDTTEVNLDCTKCEDDFEQISKGDVIRFYFFKYNIDGKTIKIERLLNKRSHFYQREI